MNPLYLHLYNRFFFLDCQITEDSDCSWGNKRYLLLGRKAVTNPDSVLKSREITLPTKVHIIKAMFFQYHVWMWELDCKESLTSWVAKNWCFWIVVLKKTLESPLDCEEIKPVNPKGNQPWIFIGSTDAEAPTLWPWRADSLEKTLMLGKIKQAEDEMVGQQHQLNGYEFEQTLGDSEGLESLVCCSPWVCKELDMT